MTRHKECISAHADQRLAVSSSIASAQQTHAALREIKPLVRAGFSVILLRARSKIPDEVDWSIKAAETYEQVVRKYRIGMNFGVRLGKWSKIRDGNRELYVYVIDVDIRDPKKADEAFDRLEAFFKGYDVWSWPRVKSGSGGRSRHFYFVTDKPFPSKKLARSEKKIPGTNKQEWEIELCGTGKQAVLPPSIHPISGKAYEWIVRFDLTAQLPYVKANFVEELVFPNEDEPNDGDHDKVKLNVTYEEVEEKVKYLDFDYWCDDRDGWIRLGMALHHEFDGAKEAFEIWCDFSKQSPKFDRPETWRQWKSFTHRTNRPVRMATIFKSANESRRMAELQDDIASLDGLNDADDEVYRQELINSFQDLDLREDDTSPIPGVPKGLLSIPGILQLVVNYYEATAEKQQRQFAVQAAIAIGSVVLGRNFVTNKRNFSTLFLLNVAPTASGKEHFKTVIEEVLEEAGVSSLLAPDEFSSGAAIFWHLTESPRTISVTDEFGIYLSTGRDTSNTLKRETRKLQMELFGRPHGIVRGIGYSMAKATKEQIEAAKNRKIIRPAFVQTGMTTPETFYAAISNKEVQSGFLNRFLIVRSPLGRQLSRRDVPDAGIPVELIRWVKKYVNANGGTEEDDDRSFGKSDYVYPPRTIPFDEECLDRLEEYEKFLVGKMNAMDKENGMGSLYGRTREIAMRLALIAAVSCESEVIRLKHLEWAWDYVNYYHGKMIEDFSSNLGKTEMEEVCDAVAQMVARAGVNGLTKREIARKVRPFSRLSIRDGDEVLARLERNGHTKFEEINTGGRKRRAYVAVKRRA